MELVAAYNKRYKRRIKLPEACEEIFTGHGRIFKLRYKPLEGLTTVYRGPHLLAEHHNFEVEKQHIFIFDVMDHDIFTIKYMAFTGE